MLRRDLSRGRGLREKSARFRTGLPSLCQRVGLVVYQMPPVGGFVRLPS